MTTKPSPWPVIAIGALGLIVGLALIFANLPIGRVLIIGSVVGMAVVLGRRDGSPDDEGAWFGRKRTGIGWTIRSWKGVVLILVLIFALLSLSYLTAGL